ncbi:MAG: V-type ATP synthase subunit D [Proteobacteria bacterium]|nr:V-type ATP synthase subunit D [Pseudomonadota bacterium]MBU4033604.1 V-type ATP synthase subunit D [Pseudomonadota bacterium]MBU4119844.1 V-type ATP synthase subunit D [Pseudomonadota bacterium]
MMHPNRTYLLTLKEKKKVIANSLNILKARRQALVVEFLTSARPFLEKRKKIMSLYWQARQYLAVSLGLEGEPSISALAAVNHHDPGVEIEEKNVLGAKYRSAKTLAPIKRSPAERYYDFGPTTPFLEETFSFFEQVVEEMLEVAGHESKLKNLGEAIQKTSRKSRVLEERILPEMASRIHMVSQYIGEREREDYFRLKRFKDMRHRNAPPAGSAARCRP